MKSVKTLRTARHWYLMSYRISRFCLLVTGLSHEELLLHENRHTLFGAVNGFIKLYNAYSDKGHSNPNLACERFSLYVHEHQLCGCIDFLDV